MSNEQTTSSSMRHVATDAAIGGGILGALGGLAGAVAAVIFKRKNPTVDSKGLVQGLALVGASAGASSGALGGAAVAIGSELFSSDKCKQEVSELKDQQQRTEALLQSERSFAKRLEGARAQSADKDQGGHTM